MSDPGVPPAAPDNAPEGGPPADVPMWLLGVVFAVILALAGVFVVALTHKGSNGAEAADPSAPSYPLEWDSRIAPYATIAEDLRDLDFEHPVEVRFLPPDKFEKTVTSDKKKLDGEDRTEIEQFTGLMRAFGLITGDVDLFAAVNDFQAAGILAYYSFDDKTITIRGNRLTPSVRSTLVHELTHALQDQHFNVSSRMKHLRKESDEGADTSEASVLRAIVEGDAERVQTLYRESLTPKQRTALDAGQNDESAQANRTIKDIPKVVVTLFTSPYALGQALVAAASADGGNASVNELFTDSPTHESALLDPFRVLAADTDSRKVALPQLQKGEKKFDSGEFGVLTWYLMLAERLPLKQALTAVDGWAGDAYVAFERDGRTCARMNYVGKTAQDSARMYAALRRWDAAAPGSPATVSRHAGVLQLESCDPGRTAQVGHDASQRAISLAVTRTYLGVGILSSGVPAETARCMAGRLVFAFPISKLADPTFGAGDPAVLARVQRVTAGCV